MVDTIASTHLKPVPYAPYNVDFKMARTEHHVMEGKDFKDLIKKKDQIEAKVAKKDARIDAIRDETSKKIRKLRRQKKKAMDACDAKITTLKAETKKKLFLLKDTKEFSKEQADKIDDMITAEFEEPAEKIPSTDHRHELPEKPALPVKNQDKEIQIAVNNFRYKVKNESSFVKEFKVLKVLIAGKPGLSGIESSIAAIEKMLSNGKSRIVREEILEKLKEIDALLG